MTAGWYSPLEESLRLARAMETPGLRWYVRLEHARPARIGERPSDGLRWASFPYVDRDGRGAPIPLTASTFHPTRSLALKHAARRTAEAAANTLRIAALNTATDTDQVEQDWGATA